jgi:hypothetical protein
MFRPTSPAAVTISAERPWLRHVYLYGPVALCTLAALFLALRALPLAGGARLIFAAAVALNVGLLALSSWSSVLGAAAGIRAKRPTAH